MQNLESNFQKKVIKFLTDRKCYVEKYPASMYSKAGVPDLYGFFPTGEYFALELKTTSRPSKLQQFNILKIRKLGGLAAIMDDTGNWQALLLTWIQDPQKLNEHDFGLYSKTR